MKSMLQHPVLIILGGRLCRHGGVISDISSKSTLGGHMPCESEIKLKGEATIFSDL